MTRTAFVSTYPPRPCGIATFTHHLAAAVGGREIVALHATDLPAPYPLEVHHRIRRNEPADYARTAEALSSCADVVSIQHADGIWGGPDGSSVLDFVHALAMPSVATLHNIPASPSGPERAVLSELVRSVAASVVMTRSAATLLATAYGADPGRVQVIGHGIPDLPLLDAETVKPAVGLAGRDVLLSFGLLTPGKGCELVLAALPAIVKARPTAMYVILGATHPDVVGTHGEAYRQSLVALVAKLGMGSHVQFVDRFVGRVELTRWLEAADVVLTPNTRLDTSSAGTLAYAMGAGRAVVSTPYAYATELLADGLGLVVPAGDPAAVAAAVVGLLDDPVVRLDIGRRAHEASRPMTWWHVAAQYRGLLGRVQATRTLVRPAVRSIALQA